MTWKDSRGYCCHDTECECGSPAIYAHKGDEQECVCTNPDCEHADGDNPAVQLARFKKRIEQNDFAIGDEFWIGNYHFEVTVISVPVQIV